MERLIGIINVCIIETIKCNTLLDALCNISPIAIWKQRDKTGWDRTVDLAVLSMILKPILHKQETQGSKFQREGLGSPIGQRIMDGKFRWKFLPNSMKSIGNDRDIHESAMNDWQRWWVLSEKFTKVNSFKRDKKKEKGKVKHICTVRYRSNTLPRTYIHQTTLILPFAEGFS